MCVCVCVYTYIDEGVVFGACAIHGTIVDNKMKQLLIARNGGKLYNTRVIGHVEWFVRCCPKGFTPSINKSNLTFLGEEPNSGHVVSTCLQALPS